MSDQALTPSWVQEWADRANGLGLGPPLLVLLDAAGAFGELCSFVLLGLQPVMGGSVDDGAISRAAALLDSPELVDSFKARLAAGGGGSD